LILKHSIILAKKKEENLRVCTELHESIRLGGDGINRWTVKNYGVAEHTEIK
jgi:hypothetical protein